MKTKELIRQLIEADPSGEEEVCVGNCDIHFIENLPAYYDGSLQVLQRDENCKFYNIIGGKYKRTGRKIQIHTLSISDAISNRQEIPVDYSELAADQQISTKKAHDDLREWHKKLDNELECQYFCEWAKDEAKKITANIEDIKYIAEGFFKKNVSPEDPFPEGGISLGQSYITTRKQQWAKKFQVVMEEGFLKIKVRNG